MVIDVRGEHWTPVSLETLLKIGKLDAILSQHCCVGSTLVLDLPLKSSPFHGKWTNNYLQRVTIHRPNRGPILPIVGNIITIIIK